MNVREIQEIPQIKIGSKDDNKIQNPYAEAYMKDKKRVVLKDGVTDIVRNIKRKRGFNSDNDTVKFLCDLENELTKSHMIKEFAKCPDCGATMHIDHMKKIHHHIDKNVECYGCLERGHTIGWSEDERKAIAEVILERKKAKEAQMEQSEQTDTEDDIINRNLL